MRALAVSVSVAIATMVAALPAFASVGDPPSGAILDLDGTTMSTHYQLYTVDFTASLADTDIAFAIRNDPSYTYLTSVSVIDTAPGVITNLVTNGSFLGTGDAIAGWTYSNPYNAGAHGGAYNGYWLDGAVGSYDEIDQVVATTVGDTYQISFELAAFGGATYSPSNDVLVYAGSGLTPAVPEPASAGLLAAGAALLFVRKRRSQGAA